MLLFCIDILAKALLNLNTFYLVWSTYLVKYFVQNPNSLSFQVTSMPERQSRGPRTLQDTEIDSITTHGFKQLISDPTHILRQSLSWSCINLIFTDQPNYIIDCSTHPSLHPNCHYQITFCKLNLKVEYPHINQRFCLELQ